MPHRVQSPHWACVSCCAVLIVIAFYAPFASAHQLLGDCVQHRVSLNVDPVNIDVEVELTFTDMRAMAERRRMDVDRDWSISREEAQGYARRFEEIQPETFKLAIDGGSLPLVPLHAPQVDLGAGRQVAPAPHSVRLFYFTRTPASLKPGSEIVLTDRLWPEAPAVLAMTVNGHDGVRMGTTPTDPFSPAVEAGTGRLLRARCLNVPEGGVGGAAKWAAPAALMEAGASAVDAAPMPIRAWLVTGVLVAVAGLGLKRHPSHRQQ